VGACLGVEASVTSCSIVTPHVPAHCYQQTIHAWVTRSIANRETLLHPATYLCRPLRPSKFDPAPGSFSHSPASSSNSSQAHSDNTHPVAQRGCCQSRPVRRRILHAEGRARDDTCKVTQPNQKPRSGCSRRFRQIVVVVPATKSAMCNEDSNAILTTSAPRLKECMRPTPSGSKQSTLRPCAPVRRCLPKPPSQ
jgi:hypothetical protein